MRKGLSIGAAIGTAVIIGLAAASGSTASATTSTVQVPPAAGPQGAPPQTPMLRCGGDGLINSGVFDHDGSTVHDPRTAAQIIDAVVGANAPASVQEGIAAGRLTVGVEERGWRQHLVRDRKNNIVAVFTFGVHPGGLLLDTADYCNN